MFGFSLSNNQPYSGSNVHENKLMNKDMQGNHIK